MRTLLNNLLFCCILVAFSCTPRHKDPIVLSLRAGAPEEVRVSSARLERIDRVLLEAVDSSWIKGAAAFIARNGTIVYHKGFGFRDASDSLELEKEAIFRIASQTKAIVTAGAMILFEEGRFLLDDPISLYLPEFRNPRVLATFNERDTTFTTIPASREITIRDLMRHTSGLDYFSFGSAEFQRIYAKSGVLSAFGSDQITLKEFVERIASAPLAHHPGEKFTYGVGVDVLGRLIEVISGSDLDDFLETTIFQPLGMEDTYFYLPKEKKDRLVPVFTRNESGNLVELPGKDLNQISASYPLTEGLLFSGGAGLSSTLKDYAIFLQMMLNKGAYNGQRILSRRSVTLMTSNQIGDLSIRNDNKFGLGFEIYTEEGMKKYGQSVGTFAWGGYWGTTYWADPKEQIVALLFVNQMPFEHRELQEKFRVMVYQALDD